MEVSQVMGDGIPSRHNRFKAKSWSFMTWMMTVGNSHFRTSPYVYMYIKIDRYPLKDTINISITTRYPL